MNVFKILLMIAALAGSIISCKMPVETKEGKPSSFELKTDSESIAEGKKIFDSRCGFCHILNSNNTNFGPSLVGLLKKSRLPVSKKPATPENIEKQLRKPLRNMPSYSFLSEEEVHNLMAYLNTL